MNTNIATNAESQMKRFVDHHNNTYLKVMKVYSKIESNEENDLGRRS